MRARLFWVSRLIGTLAIAATIRAADWPNWLGPNSNNIAPSEEFDADLSHWNVAWKAEVGRGYSSVAVAGGRAVTLGHDEKESETVSCFDAASGKVLWSHSYPAQLIAAMHPGGPNATPTLVGGLVLTLSKDGQVFAHSAEKGSVVWKAFLPSVGGLVLPKWGFSSSPVVSGSNVLFMAGRVVALDLGTGQFRWASPNGYPSGYATAMTFDRQGQLFVGAFDGKGISILKGANGAEVCRYGYKAMFDMTATTPMAFSNGERLFISGNTSGELLAFDGQKLTSVWANTEIKNAMNNSVLVDGVLYGIDGRQGTASSRLVAVDAASGRLLWSRPDFGFGTTIGIGKSHLLALTEDGELVAVKLDPEHYQEASRKPVMSKTCWTTPVFANGRIYLRNDRGNVVCLTRP